MTFPWKNFDFSKFSFLPSVRSIILNQQKPSFGPPNDRKLSHSDYFFLARIVPLFLSCLFFRFMCVQWHLKIVAKLCVWSKKCLPCDCSAPPNWQNRTYCISCYHHQSKNWFFPHIVTDFLHFLKKCFPPPMGSIILQHASLHGWIKVPLKPPVCEEHFRLVLSKK